MVVSRTGHKIVSVPAPAFTGNKIASREDSLLIGEPAQIARDRSMKKTNSKHKTRRASNVKNVLLHDHIKQFPGRYLSVNASVNSNCALLPRETARHLPALAVREVGLSLILRDSGPGISQSRGHPLIVLV